MCTTDNPSKIMMRLVMNGVQEDSFAIEYRRKSKEVPTNGFLNQQDTDTYNRVCPIDHNYVQKDGRCSGGYRQGAFQFYPPFDKKGCQCQELLDRMEESDDGYAAPLMYITDDTKKERLENPASPCIMQFMNEQRTVATMPNMWTMMNTIQLSINVYKVPDDGEILMLSNYRPDFWKN